MTILKKLEIKGIRSYNPNRSQIIKFQLPLTLIVGQNGTGKTTIIECLKYITTGVMPPNSRGGAFIYDGSLAKNTDVKAEIKLYMEDLHNREIVIQKILQSSIKFKRVEQKTLEFNVTINNESKEILDFENTIKSNNNKINQNDLTSIFNINSSILENIIFCHQDDAMWYLGDPSTIKKKFDDIFSSTRYSKILDNMKKVKKEISSKIKVIQTELSYLIKSKEKKYAIENKLKENCEELENKLVNIKGLENKLRECLAILKELNLEYNKIQIIENKRKEIAHIKNLKTLKWNEDYCNRIFNELNIESKESEVSILSSIINKQNEEIKLIQDNKIKFEKIQKEVEILKSKKLNFETYISENNTEICELEKWLDDQIQKFQCKLKLEDSVKHIKKYDEIFKFFFSKYDSEYSKKNQVILDLKKEFEKLNWEISNNDRKIKEISDINLEIYNDTEYVEIIDLEDKIISLEKEYENSVYVNKEIILNEEKKKRRNLLLTKINNKTKSGEINNLKNNTKKINDLKANCKRHNENLNKLNIYYNMITTKKQFFNAKIYALGFKETNTDLVFLGHDICNKLINLSIKNKECYLCEKKIDDKEAYQTKIKNLGDKRIEENLRIHENNYKIYKEINEIVLMIKKMSYGDFQISSFNISLDMSAFPKYIDTILNIISEEKKKLIDEINVSEMVTIDLEEENAELNENIKVFDELEKIIIKNITSSNIIEVQEKLKMYKMYKEIKDKKIKLDHRNQLFKTNKIYKHKCETLEKDIKHKLDKLENLKSNISKKKSEVDLKILDLYSKKSKVLTYQNEIDKIIKELKRFTEVSTTHNYDNYNKIIENNLHNKNKLNVLKTELMEMQQNLALVVDHLEYYKNINKFKKIEAEIKLVEKSLIERNALQRSKDSDDTIKDYLNIIQNKIESIKSQEASILEKKNILKGEINQLEFQKKNYEDDLNTEYKNIISDYNKKYLECKILDMSNLDIDKCISILDKSIIDYHYSKIEEINLTLKELWSNCYKGNDIDCIKLEINENGTKNYSYKMTIIKNGVDLDMRNRTSAGQKMIGNILLRMALSKVFCCNFNVLTLDEPTTNLDKENIESLAYTLVGITKTNPNLQLIIITHDEHFVDIMCRENLKFFYKLARNNNGDSVIIKEST